MAGKLLSDGRKALSVVAGKALSDGWNTCAAGKLLSEKRKGFDRPEKKGLAEAFVFPDHAIAASRPVIPAGKARLRVKEQAMHVPSPFFGRGRALCLRRRMSFSGWKMYAKKAFLHTSGWFLRGLYAECGFLHTSGKFSKGLYAGRAFLHTDRGVLRWGAVLVGLVMALMLPVRADACTTAIVSGGASASGRPMIWKQRDANGEHNAIAHVQGAVFAYTALFPTRDSLHRLAYAGINEAGFGISNNLSYNLRPKGANMDTHNGELMAEALGTCRTLEDFAALLDSKAAPRGLSANFAVIDACGGAAYFEAGDSTYVRYDVPEGGYLFRTNYSISGEEGRGSGFARYATMEELMARRAGKGLRPARKFDAAFFMNAGRSFVNVLGGGDALRCKRSGLLYEHDFILRNTTVASVVIEGVAQGDAADAGLVWAAPGYTPTCYAVPVWVAAGSDIPRTVAGEAPANNLSVELKHSLSAYGWDPKYLSVKPLRRILRLVRKAERAELKAGRKLARQFRETGFDAAAVSAYNADAAARFESFKQQVNRN